MAAQTDVLHMYLKDIAHTQPLSRQEETELAKKIRRGDRNARNRLISANLRFVISMAREYSNSGVPLEELISAGNLGLITAAERFDETRGFKFISYAVWWIRQAMQRAITQHDRVVRLPANRFDLMHGIRQVAREFRQTTETEPTAEDIADVLGVLTETVQDTLQKMRQSASLEADLPGTEDNPLLNVMPDTRQPAPDAEVTEKSVRECLSDALDVLDDRARRLIELYYGLDGGEPLTLAEIGLRFNISRERVRQLKEQALSELRHPRRLRVLEEIRD